MDRNQIRCSQRCNQMRPVVRMSAGGFMRFGLQVVCLLWGLGLPAAVAAGGMPPSDQELRNRSAGLNLAHFRDQPAAVLHRSTSVAVQRNGLSKRSEFVAVRVLDLAGAKSHSVLRFDYDPATSEVDIDWLRILKTDGSVVHVDPASAIDVPAFKHWIYWPFRVKLISPPDLVPGDIVVWATTSSGFQIAYLTAPEDRFVPPQAGEFYDVMVFGGELPILEQTYTLEMPPDMQIQYQVANGEVTSSTRLRDSGTVYRFHKTDIPAYPAEDRALSLSDSAAKVVLATLRSWKEKSKWFYLANEPSFAFTPQIQQLARRLVDGKKTDSERITALNRWVAHSIRYSGLSMGDGEGYTLHPGTMTLHDRCGVCKDKAGMLVTLMRAAGYQDTYAALTMAGARVEEVPADQFNHSVAAWRRPGGGFLLLDPTWAPLSRSNWSKAEASQHYVVGTPRGEELSITPSSRPEDNLLEIHIDSRIKNEGPASTAVQITGTGYMETALRRWFGFKPQDEWHNQVERLVLTTAPGALLERLSVTSKSIEDLDSKFLFSFTFSGGPHAIGHAEQQAILRPHSFSLFLDEPRIAENLVKGDVRQRKRGLRFRCAKEIRYTESIRLPARMDLVGWTNVLVSNEEGLVEARAQADGRNLEIAVRLRFAAGAVQKARLEDYARLLEAADGLTRKRLVLKRKRR